ncbi:MAG: ABC transporter substrate-binding protein [Candidatus Hydrogenedentes bacterium]|nr:ABC transporter substrate-binding protein [Candidatus Hydrogenedentota bacterium]
MKSHYIRVFTGSVCLGIAVMIGACGEKRPRGVTGTQLAYWRTLSGASGEAQDELVQRFNTANPSTQVTSEYQGTYGDLATKLVTATAARSGPDVTQLGTFEIRQFARSGALVDLRPYLEGARGIDRSDWPPTMARAGEIDGGVYWLPFNVAVPVLYYNTEAFARAGRAAPPETWTEFFSLARTLTVRNEDGAVQQAGLALWSITWPMFSMVWSEGGELTSRDYSNITLNDPVVVKLLAELQSLIQEGSAIMPDKASGGHRAAFVNRRVAMILDSQDAFSEVFKLAHGFMPGVANYPAGVKGKIYAPGGGGLAMLSTCPEDRREAAWSFMRFMLAPEQIGYYAKQTGYAAYSASAQASAGDLLGDPRYAVIHSTLPFIRADFSVNMSPAVRTSFDEAFQKIMVEGADPQTALDAADAKAEAAIKRELS